MQIVKFPVGKIEENPVVYFHAGYMQVTYRVKIESGEVVSVIISFGGCKAFKLSTQVDGSVPTNGLMQIDRKSDFYLNLREIWLASKDEYDAPSITAEEISLCKEYSFCLPDGRALKLIALRCIYYPDESYKYRNTKLFFAIREYLNVAIDCYHKAEADSEQFVYTDSVIRVGTWLSDLVRGNSYALVVKDILNGISSHRLRGEGSWMSEALRLAELKSYENIVQLILAGGCIYDPDEFGKHPNAKLIFAMIEFFSVVVNCYKKAKSIPEKLVYGDSSVTAVRWLSQLATGDSYTLIAGDVLCGIKPHRWRIDGSWMSKALHQAESKSFEKVIKLISSEAVF